MLNAKAESTAYKVITQDDIDVQTATVSTSPATITGLSPNTKYKVGVSAIGTNNDMSDYVYVNNVTTLIQAQSPVMVNVDGIVKQVIFAYINVNGVAKMVMAIYVNVNGTAKRVI